VSAALPPEIRLGNDICRAFHHLPHDAAAAAVAGHLTRFWDPRMRRAITERVREGHPDVDPLLAQAVNAHLEDDRTPA